MEIEGGVEHFEEHNHDKQDEPDTNNTLDNNIDNGVNRDPTDSDKAKVGNGKLEDFERNTQRDSGIKIDNEELKQELQELGAQYDKEKGNKAKVNVDIIVGDTNDSIDVNEKLKGGIDGSDVSELSDKLNEVVEDTAKLNDKLDVTDDKVDTVEAENQTEIVLEALDEDRRNSEEVEDIVEKVDELEDDKVGGNSGKGLKIEEKDTETDSGLEDHSADIVESTDEIDSNSNDSIGNSNESIAFTSNSTENIADCSRSYENSNDRAENTEPGHCERGNISLNESGGVDYASAETGEGSCEKVDDINSEESESETDIYEIEMGNKLEVNENSGGGLNEDADFGSDENIAEGVEAASVEQQRSSDVQEEVVGEPNAEKGGKDKGENVEKQLNGENDLGVEKQNEQELCDSNAGMSGGREGGLTTNNKVEDDGEKHTEAEGDCSKNTKDTGENNDEMVNQIYPGKLNEDETQIAQIGVTEHSATGRMVDVIGMAAYTDDINCESKQSTVEANTVDKDCYKNKDADDLANNELKTENVDNKQLAIETNAIDKVEDAILNDVEAEQSAELKEKLETFIRAVLDDIQEMALEGEDSEDNDTIDTKDDANVDVIGDSTGDVNSTSDVNDTQGKAYTANDTKEDINADVGVTGGVNNTQDKAYTAGDTNEAVNSTSDGNKTQDKAVAASDTKDDANMDVTGDVNETQDKAFRNAANDTKETMNSTGDVNDTQDKAYAASDTKTNEKVDEMTNEEKYTKDNIDKDDDTNKPPSGNTNTTEGTDIDNNVNRTEESASAVGLDISSKSDSRMDMHANSTDEGLDSAKDTKVDSNNGKKDNDKVEPAMVVASSSSDGTQQKKPLVAKEKMPERVAMLEHELAAMRTSLHVSHRHLHDTQVKHNHETMTLKLQLYHTQMQLKKDHMQSEIRLKEQRAKSEKQMSDVMSHLVVLEGRLRNEQAKVRKELRNKSQMIETQSNEIVKLKDQNEQLLNAIKEIYTKGGMNGYMRENKRKNGETHENGTSKNGKEKEKKMHNGRLGSMRDKFMAKNRSSLELNSFNLEKYLIKNDRMCSSQDELHRLDENERKGVPIGRNGNNKCFNESLRRESKRGDKRDKSPKESSSYGNGNSGGYPKSPNSRNKLTKQRSQNFLSDSPTNSTYNPDVSRSSYDSSQYDASSPSSSGVFSLSDHDLSSVSRSDQGSRSLDYGTRSNVQGHHYGNNGGFHGNRDFQELGGEDDEDGRIFSFSSTHINVIDEEEGLGPILSHSGQMMSMGSMPVLNNLRDEHRLTSGQNRPHSMSSVDLMAIQNQMRNKDLLPEISKSDENLLEVSTPPPSPSYNQSKNDLTPFQTFKTMFRRKGSKNKGKKRSVSLSHTTNNEYSQAMKKHFQKYDMS